MYVTAATGRQPNCSKQINKKKMKMLLSLVVYGPGLLSRYSDWLQDELSGDPIPSSLALGPRSLLYNGYRLSLPGVKRPGLGVDFTTPSGAEVEEGVELYLYCTAGPSWPVLGRTLPLHFYL